MLSSELASGRVKAWAWCFVDKRTQFVCQLESGHRAEEVTGNCGCGNETSGTKTHQDRTSETDTRAGEHLICQL